MKEFEKIIDKIWEEIEDSKEYSKMAESLKSTERENSETFHELAKEEIKHGEKLTEMIHKKIKEWQNQGKEIPPEMKAIWNYEHKKIVEKMNKSKMMVEMYKK